MPRMLQLYWKSTSVVHIYLSAGLPDCLTQRFPASTALTMPLLLPQQSLDPLKSVIGQPLRLQVYFSAAGGHALFAIECTL